MSERSLPSIFSTYEMTNMQLLHTKMTATYPIITRANPSHFYFMILIYAQITTLFCIKFCFNEFFKYTSLHI